MQNSSNNNRNMVDSYYNMANSTTLGNPQSELKLLEAYEQLHSQESFALDQDEIIFRGDKLYQDIFNCISQSLSVADRQIFFFNTVL
jgi:hypothetical protein